MSTRYYPLFLKGSPRLRVFLPNFYMKLTQPRHPLPPDQVAFVVSTEMTIHDIRNYLEKIYKVPVKEVKTHMHMGRFKRVEGAGYIIKNEDEKWAFVTLPKGASFKFPDLYPKEVQEQTDKEFQVQKDSEQKFLEKKNKNWSMPGIPMWFGKT